MSCDKTEDDLFGPDDLDGEWDDEPVGSCDWCGTNLYSDDWEGLCEQCAWHAEQGEGSPDVGSGGDMPIGDWDGYTEEM